MTENAMWVEELMAKDCVKIGIITFFGVDGRLIVFFFSSRRRHTRSLRDWSSDVCSSDLVATGGIVGSMTLSLEDSGARMHRIGRSLLVHGEISTVDEVVATFRQLTTEDVQRAAARLLAQPRVLAVVGPFRE